MTDNTNTELVSETSNIEFHTANGDIIVGLHAGKEYIKRMEILKNGKSSSSQAQIEQEIQNCATKFGISPQDVDALKQQADSIGIEFDDSDTNEYDDTDSYSYTDSDTLSNPNEYTHYDSNRGNNDDDDSNYKFSFGFNGLNLASLFGDGNDGNDDGGFFNQYNHPMMDQNRDNYGSGGYKVYRIVDRHPIIPPRPMQMQQQYPIMQSHPMMQQLPGQQQGPPPPPPGPKGKGPPPPGVPPQQGVINPYGPQASGYYGNNP
eukprot:CAMPEP_0201593520 /NCGR_PEP_ID=MMETSP0190_2-20130828/191099_1 /ASSEMBLY_ACC=CAM_ASM_000263 /TAXON_ID=37353 /ORGANISM="Rosalina sp." /LENGTH=260 /DNA_ID=CAMNT_0048052739 /DNA_START=23 /DNA_END=801 /DNA_ORIENTATION=+